MEVDDAVVVPGTLAVEQAASPHGLAENGGERTPRHSGQRSATKLTVANDIEEDPPELEPPLLESEYAVDAMSEDENGGSELLTTGTPLKLEVSATEDEDSCEASAAVQRQLLASPVEKVALAQQLMADASLKRKRYEVRRSGSEECLLGFDEKSGEAELIKEDVGILTNSGAVKAEYEENVFSPIASPRAAKKLKQSPAATSPRKESPKAHISPRVKNQSSDNAAAQPKNNIKKEEKPTEQHTPHTTKTTHIVADNEDTNGALASSNSPANANAVGNTTPVPKAKPLSAQDGFYKKPFEYGWKRELVWRANMETSKDKADVYFIAPSGKKLRTRSDIIPLLEGDLTIEHFSFAREPLGVGAEYETVRSAKPSGRVSATAATLASAQTTTAIGKRVSKPKGPKGASPPPQGWTPTRALKVNNAALLSSASSSRYSSSMSTPGTPPNNRAMNASGGGSSKSSKAKKGPATGGVDPAHSHSHTHTNTNAATGAASANSQTVHEPCTSKCARALGQVPQLKCMKCLCLYHHECVGLNRANCEYRIIGESNMPGSNGREYVCEACLPTVEVTAKTHTPRNPSNKSRAVRPENKYPQTIAVVKGKKYVMVAKPIAKTTEHVNDIENDLKQINESIRNSRKPSAASLDTTFQPHSVPAAPAAVDQSNKVFATNFFANVSFAYDALLCILKYLKIHERPRAASVCKLWHLAAKDTSLWHTVRMKNSKVSNWAGFAAALRRGETKHLDLRKMLVASTRGDDMWQDFCEHIGTVCSLEVIDLCRCSARVVEQLFQSNKNLRILNAVTINDDAINLEHLGSLTHLEELRLRTCEPGTITGDLHPLRTLTKLAHLSLTAIRGLGNKGVEVLGELVGLRSLELGECGDFDNTFAESVLPKLTNLQRLRLENGQETNCCTLQILDAVARLTQLTQLELVNFDIKAGFDEKLCLCTNLRKLLIIPTYISQSATTNHIVLSAVQQVAKTLKVFTWGVTVELLRVTALYVDQCEESTKKEKHHFDECIPVLKPVPGATPADEEDEEGAMRQDNQETAPSDVPQIEILPLDKVETILSENLPHTKFTIVKVPYHVTCKQQLVE